MVKRKTVVGKSRVGTGGKMVDKGAAQEQKRDIIQVNGITGRNNRGKAGDGQQWKQTTENSLTEFKLTVGKEKQSGNERKTGERVKKMEKTETTGRLFKEEKDKVEASKGGGDGEAILQKAEEEKKKSWLVKSGPRAAGKRAQTGNKVRKTLLRTKSNQSFVVEDYLQLLKLLKIKLPQGVLTLEVIKHSTDPKVTRDAQDIVQDLEKFQLKFITNPRLGCREVKHALNLKTNGDAQEITRVIFFENTKDSETTLRTTWETNVSNTGHGFRMRDKYRTTPVSTPAMYATAETRSWRCFESGKDIARITNGVRVNVQELEKMEFCDESLINQAQSSPQRFGRFLINPADEKECLKFFHELREMKIYEKLTYTKGNKVEFGFLTGNVDFLADARLKTGSAKSKESSTPITEKIIIECKGTTGDMVGKLFTKPHDGSRKAQFIETHEYCYQTQAYMYILKKVKSTPPTVRGVMVVRHYHNDSSISKDFYWNYLKEDHTKQIDALRVYCQKETLPRFLAVLCLIFQKETDSL